MLLLLMHQMKLISGGRRNFDGFMPTQDFFKKILDALCFGPFLAGASEVYKEYLRFLINAKKPTMPITAPKIINSLLMVTATVVVKAGVSDIIDIVYSQYPFVSEDSKKNN